MFTFYKPTTCPKCLGEVPAQARKCKHCGSKLPRHISKATIAFAFVLLAVWIGNKAISSFQPTSAESARPVQQASETKYGLTEAQRQQAYKELVAAERRAQREADQRYPIGTGTSRGTIMRNAEYAAQLNQQYAAPVLQKYGITEDQSYEIAGEAGNKGWSAD